MVNLPLVTNSSVRSPCTRHSLPLGRRRTHVGRGEALIAHSCPPPTCGLLKKLHGPVYPFTSSSTSSSWVSRLEDRRTAEILATLRPARNRRGIR